MSKDPAQSHKWIMVTNEVEAVRCLASLESRILNNGEWIYISRKHYVEYGGFSDDFTNFCEHAVKGAIEPLKLPWKNYLNAAQSSVALKLESSSSLVHRGPINRDHYNDHK